jgi:SAM-dependent methyltransferase
MTAIVGADHEFHDPEYAADWAGRFEPTPDRLALFDLMLSELRGRVPPDGRVVELGIGPGYLAAHLLDSLPAACYQGLDFSRAMLDIAARRLRRHADRVAFTQADLLADGWWEALEGPVDAIVSTWALHDLGGQDKVEHVYAGCARALAPRGLLLNGDFIKPAGAAQEYEPGRFPIATHLDLLRRVGFETAECLRVFEEELEAPTPAQNYACLRAAPPVIAPPSHGREPA